MNSKGKLEENIHPDFDSFPTIDIPPRIAVNSRIFCRSRRRPLTYGTTAWPDSTHLRRECKSHYAKSWSAPPKKREGANAIDYLASVYIRPDNNKDIRSYEEAVTPHPRCKRDK